MTFDKCNSLWKKCKWPKSSEIIVQHLKSSLILPVVTRWNSLYDAVQKLLRHKDNLNSLCDKLNLTNFTPEDFRYLNLYKMVMEPIAKALDFLQGEKNVNYGLLIPTLATLSNRLIKLSKSNGIEGMASIVLKMEQRLQERFEPFFMLLPEANIVIATSVLTPSVKIKWLNVLQRSRPELSKENIISTTIETICQFYEKNSNAFNFGNRSNDSKLSDHFDFEIDDDEMKTLTPSAVDANKTDQRSLIKNQFFSYLNESSESEEIWIKYSVLKEAFIAFNTPLTSSAPVERLFSFAGIVSAPRRQSLTDFSFENLVLMKANTKYL